MKQRILDVHGVEVSVANAVGWIPWSTQSLTVASADFMILISFSISAVFENNLSPQVIFPSLFLFEILLRCLLDLINCVQSVGMLPIERRRIKSFLEAPKCKRSGWNNLAQKEVPNLALALNDVVWHFGRSKINDVITVGEKETSSFQLGPIKSSGTSVGMTGPVGSGKSLLLASLVNGMTENAGNVLMGGEISYCSQRPWISSGSIKENILFFSPLGEVRLKRVIFPVCLEHDLKSLQGGIETQVGESEVNLSGDKKVRISLARTLYRQADIYLIGDFI